MSSKEQIKLERALRKLGASQNQVDIEEDFSDIGINLMICHQLLEQKDSKLDFYSEGLDTDTCFQFSIEMEQVYIESDYETLRKEIIKTSNNRQKLIS